MTVMNDIRAALDEHLRTATGLPAIVFDRQPYTQDGDTPYLRARMIPTSRRAAVTGPAPQKRIQGLYQIVICVPDGKGSGLAYDYADIVLARFNAHTDIDSPLTGVDTPVSLEYSEVGTPFDDPPFFCLPVDVAWYAYEN
jgi:hypothetical protein